jgi:hypothetical protein
VDTVGVDFVEHLDRAQSAGSVTDTPFLLPAILGLDFICPNQMENGVVLLNSSGVTKAALIQVLVQL